MPIKIGEGLKKKLPPSEQTERRVMSPTQLVDKRAWSFIALGEERQYAGNAGYDDDVARVYRYDSSVPNHKQVSVGDIVLIRGRDHLLGIAIIERIEKSRGTKLRRKCPQCGTTALKQRKSLAPLWRCNFGHTFDEPITDEVDVQNFAAFYEGAFVRARDAVPVSAIKAAVIRPSDQLSIEEIDIGRLEGGLLSAYPETSRVIATFLQSLSIPAQAGDQGDTFTPSMTDQRLMVLKSIRMRRGQQAFRANLIARYGGQCMVSGCRLLDIVEAAHIWPYRAEQDHHPDNGLLLRADLHTLFDLGLMAIDPAGLSVRFAPSALEAGYEKYQGATLKNCRRDAAPSRSMLEHRWAAFISMNMLGSETAVK